MGSQHEGTQAQNLDSPLLVCSALHSTSPSSPWMRAGAVEMNVNLD